ncbi:MAG TPA: putative N-acetylmannosamine-6-phosphate 2-epimerase [Opitutaceae bacterium]|nr:putative N-acetylmannosamine-6-phosphate 2-epimerase [Opitutaceae bacterium]
MQESLRGKLIVSCQAPDGDPFAAPAHLCLFARAAVQGGAAGIRADGAETIRLIRQAVTVPIVGIKKVRLGDGRIMITPTNEDARSLHDAGASIIALDCTARGRAHGALERLRWIRAELGCAAWADTATVEDARLAADAGADAVLSTLRGYTPETSHIQTLDLAFIEELVREVRVPVVAEGWISTPDEAGFALRAGAFAVVVGTAITRPELITARFARAVAAVAPSSAP